VSVPDRTALPLVVTLFGPSEVWVDGSPLPRLRSRKGHWLLALLTLRHGCDVERAWLAGMLWPDNPEPQALASLRKSLNDLRGALGREADRLCSPTPHSLRLELAGAAADVVTFDAAIARGDGPSLEQAVALYRGPLLEGCAEEWAFQERQVREQAYLGALETLAAQAMACGDAAAAERHLRRAVAVDPLRESAQRALMQTLAAGGNYAAAAQTYRELRLRLHHDLNAEPDPETTALFSELRAEARNRAARTLHTGTRPPAPGRTLPSAPPRHHLPQPLTHLVGREKELREIKACLATARLVTLTGPGGVGKTRLAIQVAGELAEDYQDGICFVDLGALVDPALVLQAVASELGLREESGRPLTAILHDFLCAKQLLLVLDNFEQVLAAGPRVAELVAAAPRLKVLVTSRAVLRLRGEHRFPVPPLALPDPKRLPRLELLSHFPAVALFIQRAVAASPEFAVTDRNARAIAEICNRLDGLPLAIELAAARIRLLPPQAMLGRFERRLPLLTGGARDLPARQQTLQATMDWSYDLLSEAERRLLRRLSLFAGGFTLEAAEAICPGEAVEADEVLDLLGQLVDKSLVLVEEGEGEARYRLLETIRQYGAEKLRESGEGSDLRTRHRDWFLHLVERAELAMKGPDQREWLDRLETEHDNLRAALTWSLENGEAPACLRLGGSLGRFWAVRGYLAEGRERLAQVLALARARHAEREPECSALWAKALRMAGVLARGQGDYGAARAFFEESLSIQRELDDKLGIAVSLNSLGSVTHAQGNYEAARSFYEESLSIRRGLGDGQGIADSLNNLGLVAQNQGDYEAARSLYEQSLAIKRELRDEGGIAALLNNLAEAAWYQGDYTSSRSLLEKSVPIWQRLGYKHGLAHSLNGLGNVAFGQGDYCEARTHYEESLAILRELGNRPGVAELLCNLAGVAWHEGDEGAARSLYAESLAMWRELGDKRGIVGCLQGFGAAASVQRQPVRAARLFGAAAALRDALHVPLPPVDLTDYVRHLAAVRAVLGEGAFRDTWEEGQRMTLEQAIADALQETASA
jgi:predicted ATPase/DNA-binding SARP family transcriptional activator